MSVIDRIIQAESGGNANARNPRSSASGPSQFIDSTWLAMLSKHRPDIQGSREELLALKSDPALSKAMTEAYAADNGAILSGAGLPVTPGTTYLAHFAGPKGAVGILSADPSLPAGSVLGEAAVRANPFLARMTAGDLQAWADRKMGGAAPAAQAPQSQPSPQFMASAPMAGTARIPLTMAPSARSSPVPMLDIVSDAPQLPPLQLYRPRKTALRGGFFNARG